MAPEHNSLSLFSSEENQVLTEYYNTNIVRLQVKSHTLKTRAELNHFFCLNILQAINTSNTVTNR